MPNQQEAWRQKAAKLHRQIQNNFFTLVIGIECEFYFNDSIGLSDCERMIERYNHVAKLPVMKEDGLRQYEYHTPPCHNIEELCDFNRIIRRGLDKVAGGQIHFAATPHPDQPRSGMHIHLHAEDKSGNRLFHRHDEAMSDELERSIAGLMCHLEESAALLFTPSHTEHQDHVAHTISWGANNRSTAIRLPDSKPEEKRIEYRIAPSDVLVEKLLAVILASLLDGLTQQLPLPPAIYGNASDPQYQLKKLPQTKDDAEAILAREFRLRQILAQ